MIVTVTINPCIDRTLEVSTLVQGGMNVIQSSQIQYAGKGINGARVIANLGANVTATGLMAEDDYVSMKTDIENNGIILDAVVRPGRLRVNHKVVDRATGDVTELNDPGYECGEEYYKRLLAKIESLVGADRLIVLAGGLPPGCPTDIYKRIIEMVNGRCMVILDASGAALEKGVTGKPSFVKPNHAEMEVLVKGKLSTLGDALTAAIELTANGVETVCVSLGSKGALITNGRESYYAPPVPDITVRSPTCAGDSLVAGYCTSVVAGLCMKDAFIRGVACSTGTVMCPGSKVVTRELLDELLPRVSVTPLTDDCTEKSIPL